jgi:hypothetical protein
MRVGSRHDRSVTQLCYNWITVNMLYIILLVLYNQEGDILITVHGYHVDLSKWGFILLMIGVMALDHFFSKPHLPDGEPSTPAQSGCECAGVQPAAMKGWLRLLSCHRD